MGCSVGDLQIGKENKSWIRRVLYSRRQKAGRFVRNYFVSSDVLIRNSEGNSNQISIL